MHSMAIARVIAGVSATLPGVTCREIWTQCILTL